ncbi:MAG: hypothetical protein JNK82_34250 [Myxococcaceae bacterium]|nr:hypothetical protein [Myxococcaceae bacterium]
MSGSRARWSAFLQKVSQRADEILAEAEPGFDELISMEVLDPVPLSSALTEFHARMLGLEKKIDDSWEKIDAELDEPAARDELYAAGQKVKKSIARRSKVLQVQKQAKAAHAIWELAKTEMAKVKASTRCSQCGAPIGVTVFHEASNVTCGHCKAVSVVRPGMATLMFFQGVCLHALGEEAALEESARLDEAVERYQGKRSKRKADVDAWVAAHRKYWLVYARGYGTHVPGFDEEKAKAMAEAKLGWLKLELESTRTVD